MYVNGFKFHTQEYGLSKTTYNSGVCVKGDEDDDGLHDFYGVLQEIIELTYSEDLKTILFRCEWFDNTLDLGVRRIHKNYPLIEVNHKRHYQNKSDEFVLATQATQVYYTPYPSRDKKKADWWAVVKTRPRWSFSNNMIITDDQPYQNDLDDNGMLQITEDTKDIGPLNNEVFGGFELDAEIDSIDEDVIDEDDDDDDADQVNTEDENNLNINRDTDEED